MIDVHAPRLPGLRRALRRRRRLLIALLAAVLATICLTSLAPASPATVTVVTASRSLPVGQVLGAEDLTASSQARELVPADAFTDVSEAVGQRTWLPVAAGAALTPAQLEGPPQEGALAGKDRLLVGADSQLVSRLSPGDRITLVISSTDPSGTASIPAVVAQIPEAAEGSALTGSVVAGGQDQRPILVAVAPSETSDIAYATREGWVVIAMVG